MREFAFVGNTLRKLYNSVENRLERNLVNQEERIVRKLKGGANPLTVCETLTKIWPIVQQVDESAHLKSISAPDGVDVAGRASRWNFLFELHDRRARLHCCWLLPWNETKERYDSPIFDGRAKPFPPEDSVYRQMVSQGKMLCRELTELWLQERKRRPDLPLHFRDSDAVIRELTQKGLDIAANRFTLCTSKDNTGKMSWMARIDDYSFYANFKA